MGEILSHSLAFPTVVFSVGLAIAAGYWLLVVVGALGGDHHGGDTGHAGHGHADVGHGGHAGHADVGHGGHASHGHGSHAHVDHGGHAHVGHAEVGHHAGGDGHGGDGHHAGDSGHQGLLDRLGFSGVPIMIPLSFLMLFGWGLSMLAIDWIPGITDPGMMGTILRSATLVGATVAGAPGAGFATRPFRRMFGTKHAVRRHALIGRRCQVTTQTVTETFGQAEIVDSGAGLLVQARCPTPNALVRGSDAVVFDYDPAHEIYFIAPLQPDPTLGVRSASTDTDADRPSVRTGESA